MTLGGFRVMNQKGYGGLTKRWALLALIRRVLALSPASARIG
jgi:hypothetical protein